MKNPTALKWLLEAIKLHKEHMDGTTKPTMASQQKMMDLMMMAAEEIAP